jgi:hypothetical protein
MSGKSDINMAKSVSKSLMIMAGILVSGIVFSINSLAVNCDPNLKTASNDIFEYKDRGDRCEGFYISKVATPSLDLIGYLKGKLNYELDDKEVVNITLPIKTTVSSQIVNVRSQAFPLKTYYRLDAILTQEKPIIWPIKDVLKPKALSPKYIGIYGWWKSESNKTIYVPLRAESKISKVKNDGQFRLFFRSSIDVSDVNCFWSYYKGNNLQREKQFINKIYRAGVPIVITPPVGANGICALLVTALIKGSDSDKNENWVDRSILLDMGGS